MYLTGKVFFFGKMPQEIKLLIINLKTFGLKDILGKFKRAYTLSRAFEKTGNFPMGHF